MRFDRAACLVGLAVFVGAGCHPLATDIADEDDGTTLVITLADVGAAAAQCEDPRELVQDLDNVAVAVGIVGAGEDQITVQEGLTITGIEPDGTIILEGDLTLELDPGVLRPTLEVAIIYQGREIDGDYAGSFELESGIQVDVGSFGIQSFVTTGVQQTANVSFCVASSSVDGGDPFCSTEDPDIDAGSLLYDVPSNAFTYAYTRDDVNWLDAGTLRTVRVSLEGSIAPMPIYRGQTPLESISTGGAAAEVVVELQPVTGSGPGALGEALVGQVTVEFLDGGDPTDSGPAELLRTVPLPCDDGTVP